MLKENLIEKLVGAKYQLCRMQNFFLSLFFILQSSICFGQKNLLTFEKILSGNNKINYHIDTAYCDTIKKWGKRIGPCLIGYLSPKDTIVRNDSVLYSRTITCDRDFKKGLNIGYYVNGDRTLLGFVGVKYKFSIKSFLKKTYVPKSLWIFYDNGVISYINNYKGKSKHQSFVKFYPNGKVNVIKISYRHKNYIEIYDKEGKIITNEQEFSKLNLYLYL